MHARTGGMCAAWTPLAPAGRPPPRTYRVATDFCAAVLARFRDDGFLSWRVLQCADVRALVRDAFDVWEHNSAHAFHETVRADADLTVGTDALDGRVGVARRGASSFTVALDAGACWYADRAFCHAVVRERTTLAAVLACVWMTAVWFTALGFVEPLWTAVRLLLWVVVAAVPIFAFDSLLPCLECYDFAAVMVHEVGHVLGVGHTDAAEGRTCGCGANASACAVAGTGVMYATTQTRATACLTRDDADAVRTLHGGECAAPVWCYEAVVSSGFTRLATALVYSFLVAAAVVFAHNRCRDARVRPRRARL